MKIPQNPLYIRKTRSRGRGVFCATPLKKGQVVEICPVTIVPARQQKHMSATELAFYQFEWRGESCAIAWGYGSMYNHSAKPSCDFNMNYKSRTITIRAIEDVPANTELFIDYGWEKEYYQVKGFKEC